MRHVAQVEIGRDGHPKRLQTAAARQLDLSRQSSGYAIAAGFLAIDVERQGDRRNDAERIADVGKQGRLVPLLEMFVRVLQGPKA